MKYLSDADAFIQQNPELHDQLTRFGRSLGLSKENAEDVAQDALIRLHKAIESEGGDPVRNPKAYAFAIVRNDAMRELKRSARYPEVEFTDQTNSENPATSLLTEDKFDSPDLKIAFRQAYEGLEEAERELLHRRYVHGDSYEKLGKQMNCSTQNAWKITRKIISLVLAGKVKNKLMELDPQFATEIFN